MKLKLREPINSLTHLIGGALAVIGGIVLIISRVRSGSSTQSILGAIIFSLSLILLYFVSGTYHGYIGKDKNIEKLKKLDHSSIYVLIAGSYTPIVLYALDSKKQIIVLSVIWGLTIVGIVLKIFFIDMPRSLYTSFYLIMGWMVVFFIKDVYRALSGNGFMYLVLGGVLYSIGGLIYMLKKPNISKSFGFHELFHIFIMLGSFAHYILILKYL
ncbi:MAG: hemolysin III family protein [Clostridium sp.]|nr:hemolysin III family protein [Clostridium sp.]